MSSDVVKNEYLIFSKLVPLLHLQGVAGTCARDAILLILSLSDRDLEVAAYLTSTSDICPVGLKFILTYLFCFILLMQQSVRVCNYK